jgi:hypothetical protein
MGYNDEYEEEEDEMGPGIPKELWFANQVKSLFTSIGMPCVNISYESRLRKMPAARTAY